MADSNSKKPMALLLLVVVAVLVVIMVSGKGDEFAGHDKLTTEADCTAAKGDWKKAMVAVENWDGTKAGCTDGTFTAEVVEVKDGSGKVTTAGADATCMKEAEAETCHEPVWADLTTKEDCEAAKGTFTDKVEEVKDESGNVTTPASEASCEAWKAPDAS